MYLNRNIGVKLRFKFQGKTLEGELHKLKFIMGIGGLNDLFYVKTILRRK